MHDDHTNPLLDAVDALRKPRTVVSWLGQHEHEYIDCPGTHDLYGTVYCTDVDCALQVCKFCRSVEGTEPAATDEFHREEHPPLLTLLLEGTGLGKASRSSELKIPIDADALELWTAIRDLVKLWCRQLDATYDGSDLPHSLSNWYLAHVNAHRSRRISDETDKDVTRMVEGWVRMIEARYDPPEKREWTEACPAKVELRNPDGDVIGTRICNARRIVVNNVERFAIELNVTTMTAECARCHHQWVGDKGVLELRQQTELQKLIREEENAAYDTPIQELDATTHAA